MQNKCSRAKHKEDEMTEVFKPEGKQERQSVNMNKYKKDESKWKKPIGH